MHRGLKQGVCVWLIKMIIKLCKIHDRLCVSWSSWHESRGLAHVLMVWCVVYYLGRWSFLVVFYLGTGSWSFELRSIFFHLVSALRSVLSCLDTGGVLLVLCTIVELVTIVPCDNVHTAPSDLLPLRRTWGWTNTVETCSPIVISENKCCADVQKYWSIYMS